MTGGADADVLVVGAGPAGSAAAITLARSGKRVVLADRANFPRDKCCGDGLTGPALRQLGQLGMRPADLASWQYVERSVFVSPAGRELPLRTGGEQKSLLAIATRAELDSALVDVARDAGVRVVEGARLDSASVTDEMVTAHFAGVGEMRAPFAIGADGAWSPLRRALDEKRRPNSTSGTRRGPTCVASAAQGAKRPSFGSTTTCCPDTRGRSRCRTVAPTSVWGPFGKRAVVAAG